MFDIHREVLDWGGRQLILETGKFARQADGAVVATYGESKVLATVVAAKTPREGIDFMPLTVDYQEKFYAAGRIPGGEVAHDDARRRVGGLHEERRGVGAAGQLPDRRHGGAVPREFRDAAKHSAGRRAGDHGHQYRRRVDAGVGYGRVRPYPTDSR